MDSQYTRNAKVWGIEITTEFKEAQDKTFATLNRISKQIRKEIKSGKIVNISKEGYVTLDNGTEHTKAGYKNYLNSLGIFDTNPDIKNESLKRELVIYMLERYAGYFGRNGNEKVPTITIKGKSLYYRDAFVSIDKKKKTITLPTIYGKFELKFSGSINLSRLHKEKFGGNYIVKQRAFVVAVDVPFKPKYERASSILSFDLNKTAKDWIVFNDGMVIARPQVIDQLCDDIRESNKLLDADKKKPLAQRQLRSKQRRPIRLKWKRLHKKLKNEIRKVCESIVQKAEDSKSLLSIDSVKTGQTNGTFGQDHLIPLLQTMCENKGIPFYVIPCKNTSRRCNSCGYIDKNNRKDTDTFKCISCGYTVSAHSNAADNIAHQAQRLYDVTCPYGNYARRSVDTLVTEYNTPTTKASS